MLEMVQKARWLQGPSISDQDSFAPASSQNLPEGAIVLHEDFLDFPSSHATGIPGVFWPFSEQKNLETLSYQKYGRPSYDLAAEDIPLSAHKIVRCIISPASDTTVIPMDLYSTSCSMSNSKGGTPVQETVYFLQGKKTKSRLVTGYRTNVKLDLVIWSFERFAQEGGIYGCRARKFSIDGAVLLDPSRPGQLFQHQSPVCLLGMDFLMKYPYLLFIPKLDHRGEVDFVLGKNPLLNRPYSTCTEIPKKLVVYISARHNEETGRIGCGVFFKSGSIFNLFSGVSKYGKNGDEHKEQLWERGVLMGVIKALQVVTAFPAGCEFTEVIIRTGSPPTNSLLSQMQNLEGDLYSKPTYDSQDITDEGFLCPSPHRDLAAYIYRRFLRGKSGIKIRFEGFTTNHDYEPVGAAGILAAAGAEMEEFRMRKEDTSISAHNLSSYSINKFRGQKQTKSQNVTLLEQHDGFRGNSIFVSLGLDGYFLTPRTRAQEAMDAADQKASLILSREDVISTLGYASWEGEVAATPNGFFDDKNYEFHKPSQRSDFRTLGGILGEDAVRKLNECLKENSKLEPETFLEIIKCSNRKVKVHEFLSMQTKECRDEYMTELEQKGLGKGWHFCKDKHWNGYLRRNTRLYDRKRWMRVEDEKQMGDSIFSLSDKQWNPSYWKDEKDTSNQREAERTFRSDIEAELVDMRRKMGGWPVIKEHTGRHSKEQLEKEVRRGKFDVQGDSNSQVFNVDHNDHTNTSDYPSEVKGWLNEGKLADSKNPNSAKLKNVDTDNNPYNHATTRKLHSGIGARVAARHHYVKVLDMTDVDTDESDSTYNSGSMEDSDDHTSEEWMDPGECTDPGELMDDSDGSLSPVQPMQAKKQNQYIEARTTTRSYPNPKPNESNTRKPIVRPGKDQESEKRNGDKHTSYSQRHAKKPYRDPRSILQEWKDQFSDNIILTAKGSSTKDGPCQDPKSIIQKWRDQFSENVAPTAKRSSAEELPFIDRPQQYPLVTGASLGRPLCDPIALHQNGEVARKNPENLGIENKWPPFDWMLENHFQEDPPTACG